MKRMLCGIIAFGVIAVTTPGRAADLPVKAPAIAATSSWAGFYLGAGLGFRSSDTRVDVTSASTVFANATFDLLADVGCKVGLPCALGEPFNGTAFRFAPYLGYNWQIAPRWVIGLEADFGIADQTTTLQGIVYPAPFVLGGGAPDSFAVRTSWDASARARAGVLVDPAVLFYVTAGPAWLHIESTSNCSTAKFGSCFPAFGPSVITDSTTRLGVTVGGGIEAMLWPHWILRGEYRYSDFGTVGNADTRACSIACGGAFTEPVTYDVKVRTHTATFGLAYKLDDRSTAWASAAPLAQRAYAAMPAAVSWTGFYLGAGAGIRATNTAANLDSVISIFPGFGPFNAFLNCTNPKGSGCFFGDPLDGASFRFNPYSGFNWQFAARWVAGIEADFGWADQKTTLAGKYAPGAPLTSVLRTANDTFSVRTTWDASVRARLGYLVNPSLLVYATAGPAWMHIEQSSTCDTGVYFLTPPVGGTLLLAGGCAPNLLAPAVITDSATRLGFTVGGGAEARLWSSWFARADYQYADFGTVHFTDVRGCAGSGLTIIMGNSTTNFGCNQTDFTTDGLRVRTHTATFGLAYKFNADGVVMPTY